MSAIAKLTRDILDLRGELERMRKGLIRTGIIGWVDTTACTVSVDYPSGETSAVMPWFQHGSEHRPPVVGDHVLVLDPSLGRGTAVALVGWPSSARPSPKTGDDHALYVGSAKAIVESPDVELGESPTDYAALAARVDAEIARIWDTLGHVSIVPAPSAPPDAGEPGLLTLQSLVAVASVLVQSVAASQVKVK